jgi:hypothetical protein
MTWNTRPIDGPIAIALYGPPETGEDGITVRPVTGYVSGYHVNTTPGLIAERPELAAYVVTPEPGILRRVWAGDDPANPTQTVAMRFADEAEARAVLGWSEDATE